jgi:ADP-L-glycero-D-manno-heptose 6-epimerase
MIVITGGAGFIGSVLVWKLNELGYSDIIIVDSFRQKDKWKNLAKRQFLEIIDKNYFLENLNRTNILKECDFVYHLGACSSTTESDFNFLLQNNTKYSQELFNKCAQCSVPFVYASSAATYGSGHLGYSDEISNIDKLQAINPYGFSKKIFDSWVIKQTKRPPLWMGMKFFNVYGPNEYHKEEMKSLIAKAIPQIKANKSLQLFKSHKTGIADGEQKRDFIYVKDVVSVLANIFLAYKQKNKDIHSGVYNLGTGKSRSFVDLGRAIFSALDLRARFQWIDIPDSIREQYQYFTEASVDNLNSAINEQINYTNLEDGVRDYIKNYLLAGDPYI